MTNISNTCDNTKLFNDKFAKVSLYFWLLNKSFKNNFKNEKSFRYAIDESIIPYYGKHGAKQHIHGKPIDFTYEIWSLCASTGFLVHFILYQGAELTTLSHQNAYGLGASVVLEMVSVLPQGPLYDLFFDRFFIIVDVK